MYKYKSLHAAQLPRKHLSFLQNLLNFTITKYLKHEADDDLSLRVIKGNDVTTSKWRSVI